MRLSALSPRHLWIAGSIGQGVLLLVLVASYVLFRTRHPSLLLVPLFALLTFILTLLYTPQRREQWQRVISGRPIGVGAVIVTGCLLLGTVRTHFVQGGLIGLSVLIPVVLATVIFFPARPFHFSRQGLVFLGLLAAAVLTLRIVTLSSFPVMNDVDEPWNIAFSMSYLRDGYLSDIITLQLSGVPGHIIPKFMIAPALWIQAFGLSYWSVRLFHFLLLLPVVIFSVLAARNWYGTRTATLTFAFMFVSMIVIQTGSIRQEVGLALAVSASFWLHTEADRRERLWLHGLAGVLLGLGGLAHLHATVFGVALALGLYLPRWVRSGRWRPPTAMIWYGLGGLVSGSAAVAPYILPSTSDFMAVAGNRPSPGVYDFFTYLGTHLFNSFFHTPIEFILTYAAIFAAVLRRDRRDAPLLLTFLLAHVGLAFVAFPSGHYIRPLMPFYALLIARLFDQRGEAYDLRRAVAVGSVLAFMLGLTLAIPVRHITEGRPLNLPQQPAATWIREHVPSDAMVLAPAPYYLWLTDYPFTSTFLWYNVHNELGWDVSSETVWDWVEADVIVEDDGYQDAQIPGELFQTDYLSSRGYEVVADFSTDARVMRVYRRATPASPR